MAERNMIIIAYFLLLHPGEYTASKAESTPFRLEYNTFSCACCIFAATATEGDRQAANFVTLTFTTQIYRIKRGIYR